MMLIRTMCTRCRTTRPMCRRCLMMKTPIQSLSCPRRRRRRRPRPPSELRLVPALLWRRQARSRALTRRARRSTR